MRFLYVAPRYHTNQTPIMKGLIENGHEVLFLSHYAGKIEDYSCIKPVIVGYSVFFRMFDYIYVHLIKKNAPHASDKKIKYGYPPFFSLAGHIRRFKPDVVILRERSVYTIFAYLICCIYHYPSILYNQSPLWEEKIKNDLPHRIIRKVTPKVRMTPVMGTITPEKVKEPNAYFVPFVMEKQLSPEDKQYCQDGKIHIFSIGKYEKRKNHQMMMEAVEELSEKYPLQLTIAGECSAAHHKEYFDAIKAYAAKQGLEDRVTLLTNLSREQINEEYGKADVFVMPSTLEPASISQLEAMGFSLPVICSDTNGTACYVEEGINGYLFRDNNKGSLKDRMESLIEDKNNVVFMGSMSYKAVKEKYYFENYLNGIVKMLNK